MALTSRRKADRLEMIRRIERLAIEHGCTIDESIKCLNDSHSNYTKITHPAGAHLSVDFDGLARMADTHVICWNTSGDRKFSPRCWTQVNPYHFGKAQCVLPGFDALEAEIRRGLIAINDGSAFQ